MAALAVVLTAAFAPSTHAQEAGPVQPGQIVAGGPDAQPRGFRLSAGEAVRVAERVDEVRRQLARGQGLKRLVAVPAYTGDPYRWQVTYSRDGKGVVEVHVDARGGRVLEVWTGPQVDFLLARPWEDKMGRALNAAWIWIPLCVLFLLPFVDPRRPLRLLHLDLLVLLSFGIAQLLFNEGKLELWVPAVYPVLGYLFVRLLVGGLRPRERVGPLVPYARDSWLAAGLVLLVAGRIALNVLDSTVIDVGFTSVSGADALVKGHDLSVYGPITFLAYVPFELAFPWRGAWDALPAAHAAAITFDLLTILGLLLVGRRLRGGREGRTLGLALAYAWAAFPYSTYVLQSNTNDALPAALMVFAIVAIGSPVRRGVLLGLGGAAKVFPLALVPLLATGAGDRRVRSVLSYGAALVATCGLAVLLFLPEGGLGEMWRDTIGYQLERDSPFSLWGLHPSLDWIQTLLKVATVALCVALAFVPRQRDLRQVAALGAAALIAVEICATHWFFFYIAWFAPLALIAMLGAYQASATRHRQTACSGPRRSRRGERAPIGPPMDPHPRRGAPAPTATVARPRSAAKHVAVVALFSATLALSAGLVFMVQPMFARFVLPMLGGTPAVWNTAMLFFQTALLLAYVYAHWTIRRFGARRQAALHLAVVAAALIILPIGVPDGWGPPETGSPVLWLLLLLVVAVGLPFFVVAATAPLLQSWLASTDHPDGRDPYFLYRASNIGSVVGLLSYPLLVEPRLTLDAQSWMWSGGYALLGLMLTACAWVLWRSPRLRAVTGGQAGVADVDVAPATETIAWPRRIRWVALAAVPSSLMLGVTTTLTTNIAPIPLLWVLPLSLYLISFILVFSRGEGAGPFHRAALFAAPVLIVLVSGMFAVRIMEPLWLVIPANLIAFFVVALALHGELASDRPPPSQLTQFYAFVSVGGALGGCFNVLVAPTVFNSLTEYPIALILAAFLLPMRAGSWSDQMSFRRHLLPPLLIAATGTGALILTEGLQWPHRAVMIALALACLLLARNSLRFGLAVALALVAVWIAALDDTRVIHQDRSFFGVHRVESELNGVVHRFKHGPILHGAQIGALGITPITYYHPTGPIGQVFDSLPDRSLARRTGIVGLGVGSMACYSRKGDNWTFFEIDSAVVDIARDSRLFSFLRDCKGDFDIVLGDGRRSLERQPDGRFGVLALDAFSADAIPIHLLTREAMELYLQKLKPNGVLAFHISNRYLDLEPQLGRIAEATGLVCRAQSDYAVNRNTLGKSPSQWAVLARRPAHLGKMTVDPRWHPCRVSDSREWSDDYANILSAVRWR